MAYSIASTYDGNYIVTGWIGDYANVLAAKINSNGDTIWTKRFGGLGYESGYSIKQTADSGFVLVGIKHSYLYDYDVYLIKTDKNGFVDAINDFSSEKGSNVSWFPNPFQETSVLQIKNFKSKSYTLTIYSSTDQVLKTNITRERTVFNKGELASGIYFYLVTLNGQEIGKGKLVVQ